MAGKKKATPKVEILTVVNHGTGVEKKMTPKQFKSVSHKKLADGSLKFEVIEGEVPQEEDLGNEDAGNVESSDPAEGNEESQS